MGHDPTSALPHRASEDQTLSAIRAALMQDDDTAPDRTPRTARRSPAPMGMIGPVMRRLRGFRPATRHVVLAAGALMLVVRPHWVVMGAVALVAMVLGAFLIAGPDRIWRAVLARLSALEARDPKRAMRVRTRLDRLACRWDAILDRFPEGWVHGLYMPDVQGGTAPQGPRAST